MTSTSFVEHKKYIKLAPKQYEVWKIIVLEYEQYSYPDDLEMVSNKIRNELIDSNLPESKFKFCPPKFREINKNNPLFGHCYHATQAMYYFFKDANLKAMSAKCQGPAGQHWWLQDGDKIIDITAEQYDMFDFDPPYDKGKETKWYGWKNRPHRKTQELMRLVRGKNKTKLEHKVLMEKPKKSY